MLEACDYMMDLLNESKARQRYVANKEKEADKLKKELSYRQNVFKAFPTAANKAKYEDTYAKEYSARKTADLFKNADKTMREHIGQDGYNQRTEEDFRRMFNIPRGKYAKDQSAIGQRKPGTVKRLQDQKRAIEETCLNILAALDDID